MPDPDAVFWTVKDVAEYWNIKPATVHVYRTRKWLPEQDDRIGNAPVWFPETITSFKRPGRGTRSDLAGRPPKPPKVPKPRRTRQIPLRSHPSLVYYLRFGDRIKIGTTTNLGKRVVSLPCDKLLAVEPGGRDVERRRHREFAHLRVTGEWFHAKPELMTHIEGLSSSPEEISRLTSAAAGG